jgi:hypothetical protein
MRIYNQLFFFTLLSKSGNFFIAECRSKAYPNKVLNVETGQLSLSIYQGIEGQKWNFEDKYFISHKNKIHMEVTSGYFHNGAQVRGAKRTDNFKQMWSLGGDKVTNFHNTKQLIIGKNFV